MSKRRDSPAKTNGSTRNALCVLGASRSGTSAATRILSLMGGYLGEKSDLMPAAFDNPSGFWEHLEIFKLNEQLLGDLSLSWHSPLPLTPAWQQLPQVQPYRERIVELISDRFGDKELWIWKDPRSCLLLPLWAEALQQLGISLHCVLVVRKPLDVARSLANRNSIPIQEGLGLWYTHMLSASFHSVGYPRSVLVFEDLLEDWRSQLDRCIGELAIRWPRRPPRYAKKIEEFLDRKLVHHETRPDELLEHLGTPRVADLHSLLLRAASEPGFLASTDFIGTIENLFSECEEVVGFLEHDRRAARVEIDRLRNEIDSKTVASDQLAHHIEELVAANEIGERLQTEIRQLLKDNEKTFADQIGRQLQDQLAPLLLESKAIGERESAAIETLETELDNAIKGVLRLQEDQRRTGEEIKRLEAGLKEGHSSVLSKLHELDSAFRNDAELRQRDDLLLRLRSDLASQTERVFAVQAESKDHQSANAALAADNTSLRKQLGELEALRAECNDHQSANAVLEADNTSLRKQLGELEALRAECNDHQSANAVLEADNTSLRKQLGDLEALRVERNDYQSANASLEADLAVLQTEVDGLKRALESARAQIVEEQERSATLENAAAKLRVLSQRLDEIHSTFSLGVGGLSQRLQRQNAAGNVAVQQIRDQLDDLKRLETEHARATMLWQSKPWQLYLALGRARRWLTTRLSDHTAASLAARNAGAAQNSTFQPLSFVHVEEPRVSIVIPSYNGCDYTYKCLRSIRANTASDLYEVIVVNDVSTDETAEMLDSIENIQVITNPKNVGFLRSINAGARRARGQFTVLFNNDTEVQEGWLDAMLRLFDTDPVVGAVGPKFVYPDGSLQEAGGLVFKDGSAWNYGNGDNPEKPQYNFVRETDYVTGAALMVRSDLFNRLGLLDERYVPIYYEETDLCMGIRNLGYKVMYQPAAVVVHHEGAVSGTDTSKGAKRFQAVNRHKLVEKWHGVLEREHCKKPDSPSSDEVFLAISRRAEKRILVVDHYLPEYDKDSGSLRMFGWLKALAALGNHVAFLPDNRKSTEPYASALQQSGVEVISGPISFDDYLRKHGRFLDIAILSRPHIAIKYIETLRSFSDIFIMYDTVDLGYLREGREAEVNASSEQLKKAHKLKNTELYLASQSDMVLTVSDLERSELLKENPELRVETIPHVLEPASTVPPYSERSDLIFIGGFNHPPNADAMLWFVNEIMPLIERELPDTKLHILGSHPPESVRELSSEKIIVTGYIEDVSPYFESGRVFVAPLRFGAGVKGKILQTMSFGVPMVTTSVGAEGLGLTDGETALVADDPHAFAERIITLYNDEQLWSRLSKESYELLKRTHTAEACRVKFAQILEALNESRSPTAQAPAAKMAEHEY